MGDPNAPLKFPAGIPLVGQPCTFKAWFPTVLITCTCREAAEPILLVGEAPALCPACRRGFVIASIAHHHGQPPQISIGLVRPSPEGQAS